MICGYRDERRALLSDKICTALQLANFWQDCVRDSEIPRRYIPAEYMERFNVAEGQIEGRVFTPEFGAMMRALVERTRDMLREGAPLTDTVDDELARYARPLPQRRRSHPRRHRRAELRCSARPARRDPAQEAHAARRSAVRQTSRRPRLRSPPGVSEAETVTKTGKPNPDVAAAYLYCREIARREAKNFYWAFRVLPAHKSDAMCAVYAFMRRADDIADDESKSIETRRQEMATFLKYWRSTRQNLSRGASAHNPAFLALADTQHRFNIPDSLLEELVAGTTMDLEPAVEPRTADLEPDFQTYATFEDLYRYCYLVASVVGLVCIRIFGYSDLRAEQFAEETGVAFQLTNILRDVKEDVERGRVYIPVDLLDEFGETPAELAGLARGRTMTERERAMLATLAIRAEKYYLAANKLIPLLDRDSRAAMWVLVTIYHRLLSRIADHKMEVFRTRVSLSTAEKLLHLRPRRRYGSLEPRTRMTSAQQDVVVIGAGVAGLAAATALATDGARVTLLERRPFVRRPRLLLPASGTRRNHRLPARHPRLLHQLHRPGHQGWSG